MLDFTSLVNFKDNYFVIMAAFMRLQKVNNVLVFHNSNSEKKYTPYPIAEFFCNKVKIIIKVILKSKIATF